MAADAQRNLEPPVQRGDAGPVVDDAVQTRRIQAHGGVLSKRVDTLFVGLVRRCHDSDSAHRVLRHQSVGRPHVIVDEALEPHLVELLGSPGHAADVVTGRVELPLQTCEGVRSALPRVIELPPLPRQENTQ